MNSRIPNEKLSSFSVYTGGSLSASGDMKAWVPGHVVIVACHVAFRSVNLDFPKSVTLARVLVIVVRCLLERSR